MSGLKLKEDLLEFAKEEGADLVGVADLDQIDFPKDQDPRDLFETAESAISVGKPINKASILNLPMSRGPYMLEFNEVNRRLNSINHKITNYLEEKGHNSLGVPINWVRPGSDEDSRALTAKVSHKHVAVEAGNGEFGINNLVINEEYGPRCRYTTILTTADLEPDELNIKTLCDECERCVEICPVNALDDWENKFSPREGWKIDKQTCYHYIWDKDKLNGQRCGLCIKACPYTKN